MTDEQSMRELLAAVQDRTAVVSSDAAEVLNFWLNNIELLLYREIEILEEGNSQGEPFSDTQSLRRIVERLNQMRARIIGRIPF